MSFTGILFKLSLLLFTTWPSIQITRQLVSEVAITQHVFLARSLRSGNSNLYGLTTTGECRYAFVPQAICSIEFLMSLSHTVTWTISFFPDPHQVQPAHAHTALWVPAHTPQHARFNPPRVWLCWSHSRTCKQGRIKWTRGPGQNSDREAH